MRTNANTLKNTLNDLNKKDIIDFAIVLYRKYFLEEKNINYIKLSNMVIGLIGFTIGISYNDMHQTEESKQKENYKDWITKMAHITLKL